jgi:hypothetical protein
MIMRKTALCLISFVVLAGCATKSAVPLSDELTIRLITVKEATGKFYAEGATNPFTGIFLAITSMPSQFLTAALHVPKNVGQVEVEQLTVVSEDEKQIAEAMTKEEMVEYWNTMPSEASARAKQMEAIERYYLPSTRLEGKKLGNDYAVVFISRDPYSPTDRVEARFLVDGEEKVIELDVSSIIKKKAK